MTIEGEYVPSPRAWVREQVEKIEAEGTTRAVHIMHRPVVLLTMHGLSGKVRKVPLMRVEHDGVYAAVASQGGTPAHPKWYANLRKNPVIELPREAQPELWDTYAIAFDAVWSSASPAVFLNES